MTQWVDESIAEGKQRRRGRAVMGVEKICSVDTRASTEVPDPPWFEERRRMVVWDNPRAPDVRAYLNRYWDFQRRSVDGCAFASQNGTHGLERRGARAKCPIS